VSESSRGVESDATTFRSIDPVEVGHEPNEAHEEPVSPVAALPSARRRPTPHISKLRELLNNPKVPESDHKNVHAAIARYEAWISAMAELQSVGDEKVSDLVRLLNDYKRSIELELIWDSSSDFLFRQRGQLKIDNSIIEEFLPWLVDVAIIPELADDDLFAGPASAYAATYFSTTIAAAVPSLGMRLRTKDQDFTISRQAYLRASFDASFASRKTESATLWLAYVAAECKTNLDKTMFQEASATSHDLKVAMPGARYYLICEYLDMTPISTSGTDIDEVLILRGKRLASNKRSAYSSADNRVRLRDEYVAYLDANPIRVDIVLRFVEHLRSLFQHKDPDENDAVLKGYF